MTGLADTMKDAEVAKTGAERRRFRRVKVDIPGRLFIPADSREARCTISDLSPGGAAISCEIVPEICMRLSCSEMKLNVSRDGTSSVDRPH